MKMIFRKATKDDSEILLRWRNDSDTRANSLNTAEVKREDHEAWLEKTLKNRDRTLYVIEEDGNPVGTMRADKLENENGYELSWTVAPEARGRGVGKRMLLKAVEEFKNYNLKAVIKKENIASIKMTEAAGFHKESEKEGVSVWWLRRLDNI